MSIKAITFDFWKTLAVDSAPVKVRELSAERMVTILRREDIAIDCEKMLKAFVECRKLCYCYQEDRGIDFTPRDQLDWILDYFRIKPDPETWNGLFDAYTTSLFDYPPNFTEGLPDVLGKLSKKYKLAIISNTGRTPGWVVRCILADAGLKQYFNVLVFSNEMEIAKPNSYIFRIAARMLKEQPENIMHIGDHIHTDVAGALKADYKAAWYNPAGIKAAVKCDLEVKDFLELLNI